MKTSPAQMPRFFMLIAGMVTLLGPLSVDLYLPALPAIQRDLNATEGEIQATMAFFLLGLACGQVLYGQTSDAFGRKRPLAIGLCIYIIGVLGCSLSTDATTLTWFRLVEAIGGCAGGVIVRAMIRDRLDTQDMARSLATLTLVMGIAPVIAPIIGAVLFNNFGWRATFWALAVFASAGALAMWKWMPETRPNAPNTLAISSILPQYATVLRHRRFMGYAVAGAVSQAGMFAYISTAPFVFTKLYGLPEAHLGWLFAATGIVYILGAQANRHLLRRHSAEVLLRGALFAYLLLSGILAALLLVEMAPFPVFTALILAVIVTMGFTYPNSTAVALSPFGEKAGLATSLLGTMQFALAGIITLAIGHAPMTSAVPLACTMFICAALAELTLRVLVKPTCSVQDAIAH